jgi:hypothetical protein
MSFLFFTWPREVLTRKELQRIFDFGHGLPVLFHPAFRGAGTEGVQKYLRATLLLPREENLHAFWFVFPGILRMNHIFV